MHPGRISWRPMFGITQRRSVSKTDLSRMEQGTHMSTIHFKLTTAATPEQFIAGLTDFGPGRKKLFGNSTDLYLKVHKQGSNYADVSEGSGRIRQRLYYDWSDPTHIVLTTTDSNFWGGRSGHTYTLTRQPNGTTDIDVVIVREGKNFKGRLVGAFLGILGKGQLEKW